LWLLVVVGAGLTAQAAAARVVIGHLLLENLQVEVHLLNQHYQ
jgi:hypothetical protein